MSLNIDEQYRIGWMGGAIAGLKQRVDALEREVDAMRAKKSDTYDGRCIVPEARVLRWERIERAARRALWEASLTEEAYEVKREDGNDLWASLK